MGHVQDWTGESHEEYWVNLNSGEIEEGRQSSAAHRMGPYATREEAQRAFENAALRTEAWEEEDRRWKDDDWPEDKGGGVVP